MRFYLGTHKTGWLSRTDVPLFVSDRRLRERVKLPRALGRWALDSGGFTELSLYGRWVTTPGEYAARVRRYSDEIGGLDFAAVQDWMCEPFMLEKTSSTVQQHQQRTIDSVLELHHLQPDLPWLPVLQGWTRDDYLRHLHAYAARGIDLMKFDRVGLGSVCRRQSTTSAAAIVRELGGLGLQLHLFGYKRQGLAQVQGFACSSDSMAWSFAARRRRLRMEGCTHQTCNNCLRWALHWRNRTIGQIEQPAQLSLFG